MQVKAWQKLSAALAPSAAGEWDLTGLREAVAEGRAAGLLRTAEAEATLHRVEEAAKERAVRQKMRREAEKNLSAAMPSIFGMNKVDAARLGKAVNVAKKAGVDERQARHARTPRRSDAQTLRRSDTQTPRTPGRPEHPDTQTPRRPAPGPRPHERRPPLALAPAPTQNPAPKPNPNPLPNPTQPPTYTRARSRRPS